MSASIKNIEYLKRAVARLVKAETADSWKGSQPKEVHASTEAELRSAKAQYQQALRRLGEPG